MAHLDLSLLGGFEARLDGQPVIAFAGDKARALLAYLALEGQRPKRREALAALLWPERPESAARANLSQVLFSLRTILGDRVRAGTPEDERSAIPFLSVSEEAIQFNPASDHRVDAATFTTLLDACAEHAHDAGGECAACAQWLSQAVALYRGSFLQDLAIADSVPFEEWAAAQRERLHRLALEALQRLAATDERQGEYERGLGYAWRQVELDPWREDAQRQLMRLLAFSGRRSEALAQYEACRHALAEELGVEPEAETVALYESIRQGTLELPPVGVAGALPAAEEGPEARRTPFVARQRELAHLAQWLGVALRGEGRVGFVVGEPGSGKTMLLQEFARRAMTAHPELVVAWGSGNAYSGLGDAYLPFLEALRMLSGDVASRLAGGGISPEHGRRLWGALPTVVQALVREGPELIDLLVPGEGLLARARAFAPTGAPWRTRLEELLKRKAASPPRADLQQTDLFEQYTHVLQALARERPLLLVLDDLQWADAGSISLLFHLGRRLAGSRVLVLGAYRPEEVALGRGGERHPLEAVLHEFQSTWGAMWVDLGEAQGREFVDALVDSEPNALGDDFREGLYQRTGGQALFTVELLRGLQERGDLVRDAGERWVEGPSVDWDRLPSRVEGVVAERIERLPEELREVLSVASVEGEEFTAEVLTGVQGVKGQEVVRSLSGPLSKRHRLVSAEDVRRLGERRLSRYRFRHFLFQRYLYQGLDEVERTHLHEAVGNALEALYGATPSTVITLASAGRRDEENLSAVKAAYSGLAGEVAALAPQLARHFEAAGLTEKAVSYLQQAAERTALSLLGYEEAIVHLTRGVSLLQELPGTLDRARTELVLQLMLACEFAAVRGLASPEYGRACARAYELARRIGEARLIFTALANVATVHRNRAELRLSRQLEEQLLDLARRELPQWLDGAHTLLGHSLFRCGEFAAARWHLEQAPRSQGALDHLAYVRWYMGYPDQALRMSWDVSALFGDQPATRSVVHQLRREVCATLDAAQALAEATDVLLSFRRPWAMICLGWVHAQSGQAERGITEMRQGAADFEAQGFLVTRSQCLALLAEGYALAGRPEEGLAAVAEALEHVKRTEERYYEAELHRLRGELLHMQRADPEEVEDSYRQAIAVAQRQEAKSWELRATMSLARLLRDQGRAAEARVMLAAIYGWFTEGFDTPDLRDAKVLLEELQRA